MTIFTPSLLRLTIAYDDLLHLGALHSGELSPRGSELAELRTAGVVTPDGLHPVAAQLAELALAPARSVVVERFDGTTTTPLFLGWSTDGRAVTSRPDEERRVLVEGSELRLLRPLLEQWLTLFERGEPAGRVGVSTDTATIDRAMTRDDRRPTGDDELDAVLAGWRLAWRASGSWQGRETDATLTVVDAGGRGWWRVEHPVRVGQDVVPVGLVPVTHELVLDQLGDVVTGRRSTSSAPG